MIQSPIGTNHLDPSNPVEGFAYYFQYDSGTSYGTQITGVETDLGSATFTEPKGAGKLPLVAKWFNFLEETITANPKDRTITIKFTAIDAYADGIVARAAQPVLDGDATANFGASQYSALAYKRHGLSLSNPDVDSHGYFGTCGGIISGPIPPDLYDSPCLQPPFTGTGAIYTEPVFTHVKTPTIEYTYRIF